MRSFFKKLGSGVIVLFLLLCTVSFSFTENLFIPQVQAQTAAPAASSINSCIQALQNTQPDQMDAATKDFIMHITTFIGIVMKAFLSLNLPIVVIIGKLLSNDWIYAEGNIRDTILNLWRFNRNIGNIVLAGLFLQMIYITAHPGSDKNNGSFRTRFPKYVIGLITINISLLIFRIILDLGNIATTASFSIVNEIGPSIFTNNDTSKWTNMVLCQQRDGNSTPECLGKMFFIGVGQKGVEAVCKVDPSTHFGGIDETRAKFSPDFIYGPSKETFKDQDASSLVFNARNAIFIYSYSIFRIADIEEFFNKENPSVNFTNVTGLAVQVITAALFGGALVITNVAILVAMAIRSALIWGLMIFSPFIGLEIVLGKEKISSKIEGFKEGILPTFFGLAIMPAVFGAVLSIMFLMYHALMGMTELSGNGVISLGFFQVFIGGGILPSFASLQQLILAFMMLAIMWKGVFMALKSNALVAKGVAGIEKFGGQVADIGKKFVTTTPIIPTPKGWFSPASISKGTAQASSLMEQKASRQAADFRRDVLNIETEEERLQLDHNSLLELRNLQDRAQNLTQEEFKNIRKQANEYGIDNTNLVAELVPIIQRAGNEQLATSYQQNPRAHAQDVTRWLNERAGESSESTIRTVRDIIGRDMVQTPPVITSGTTRIRIDSGNLMYGNTQIQIPRTAVEHYKNRVEGTAGENLQNLRRPIEEALQRANIPANEHQRIFAQIDEATFNPAGMNEQPDRRDRDNEDEED